MARVKWRFMGCKKQLNHVRKNAREGGKRKKKKKKGNGRILGKNYKFATVHNKCAISGKLSVYLQVIGLMLGIFHFFPYNLLNFHSASKNMCEKWVALYANSHIHI